MHQLKKHPPADKLYSTYWWLIELDRQHEMNAPNVFEMTGYSKFQGQDEAKDKNQLLLKKILMLISRGYLDRSKKIEFFYKDGLVINKNNSPLIVTLKKNDFSFSSHFLQPKFHDWHKFVNELYQCLRTGKGVKHLLPKQKPDFSKDDYFDINLLNFTSISQLDLYCAKLARNGHPFDRIKKFHDDYQQQKSLHP